MRSGALADAGHGVDDDDLVPGRGRAARTASITRPPAAVTIATVFERGGIQAHAACTGLSDTCSVTSSVVSAMP